MEEMVIIAAFFLMVRGTIWALFAPVPDEDTEDYSDLYDYDEFATLPRQVSQVSRHPVVFTFELRRHVQTLGLFEQQFRLFKIPLLYCDAPQMAFRIGNPFLFIVPLEDGKSIFQHLLGGV